MSWQLASFTLLAAVVAGGFWWYERSRPPARLVALVAALAALAVAGRLVFAPVPNLVATTDIALITGFALGAAPGFAVGALAAPISNIWLGQGPWTAWQMAAWGLVGLAGAALALLSGRRLGRLGLALACAGAGLAYGLLLDLSVMVTYGGEQSLDRFLALSARGLPFNVVHALGNFAIALAAGPALVRLISRYRTRLEFSWPASPALPLVLLAFALPALASPAPAEAKAKSSGAWLVHSQNADGGFAAARDQPSSPAMTGWAMLGLEASGRNPRDVRRSGKTPVTYLRKQIDRVRSATDLERTILALAGSGLDPRRFAGTDLVARLREKKDGDGSVDGQVNITAFYVLALRAAGVDPGKLKRPIRWLRKAQGEKGGWGFQPQAVSDPDSTGAALQALAAVGATGKSMTAGVHYLRRAQRSSGGFALSTSGVVNSQSTAWAVQGMVAAQATGKPLERALGYLDRMRSADGHFRYSSSSDQTPVWVTAQALLATNRHAFPLAAVAREPAATTQPNAQTQPDSTDGSVSAPPLVTPGVSTPPPTTGPLVAPSSPVPIPEAKPSGGGDGRPVVPGAEDQSAGPTPDSAEQAAPGGFELGDLLPPAGAADDSAAAADDSASAEPVADEQEAVGRYVLLGFAALAAALAGGFLWYQRGLP